MLRGTLIGAVALAALAAYRLVPLDDQMREWANTVVTAAPATTDVEKADASEAAKAPSRREYFFGAHDENRVAFSRGRDLVLAPSQKGYAQADGKPIEVDRTIRYRDLPPAGAVARILP